MLVHAADGISDLLLGGQCRVPITATMEKEVLFWPPSPSLPSPVQARHYVGLLIRR